METDCPLVFDRLEIRRGSGGAGRMAGGDGQVVEFHLETQKPWLFSASASSVNLPPDGLGGGGSGKGGVLKINNVEVQAKEGRLRMAPGDAVQIETPGGGGFGAVQLA
jgi:N-methylhydantoinase B